MNSMFIAAFGVVLVIVGFYTMSFGFSTPPNISFFFTGLIITVFGGMAVIIYGSQPEDLKTRSNDKKIPKISSNAFKDDIKAYYASEQTEVPKPTQKIRPVAIKKPQDSSIKKLVREKKELKNNEHQDKEFPKEIEAIKIAEDDKNIPSIVDKIKTDENNFKVVPKEIKPVSAQKSAVDDKIQENGSELVPKEIKPVPIDKDLEDKPRKFTDRVKSTFTKKESQKDKVKKDKPEVPMAKKVEPVKHGKSDDEYVKNRLKRLKDNTLKNAKDIENLIEERLDSFKGTLDQIKSESKDPSIIWSFDAGDVQKTMQNTILKADEKILMMYPWIRNIEVSVLKKFIETDSRMILQEASLDDDASVELIKLLIDNNVKIRTMPYVHTIAIVSDENNGLIISTDPIYESFEVGVIYKDQKSIEEIERMFDEAWKLSQEIDLR